MRESISSFRWLRRPPFVVGFFAVCLFLGAIGAWDQRVHPAAIAITPSFPQVRGASTTQQLPLAEPDCTTKPCIALTFDDGPDARITPQVLDVLARQQIHATFFLVGREVPGKETLLRRMHLEGHEIGNHTWDHPDLTAVPPQTVRDEFLSTQAVIASAGVPTPRLFRPPYGAVSPMVRAQIPNPMIRWDVDTEDWKTQNVELITNHLLQDVHPGAIILMHDRYDATLAALEPALVALKQNYQFVTIPQLLELSAGDQGQFFSR